VKIVKGAKAQPEATSDFKLGRVYRQARDAGVYYICVSAYTPEGARRCLIDLDTGFRFSDRQDPGAGETWFEVTDCYFAVAE
jgi:hypothetical protein